MKYSTAIKPKTLALLKILALGKRQAKAGKTVSANEVFRRLRERRESKRHGSPRSRG